MHTALPIVLRELDDIASLIPGGVGSESSRDEEVEERRRGMLLRLAGVTQPAKCGIPAQLTVRS